MFRQNGKGFDCLVGAPDDESCAFSFFRNFRCGAPEVEVEDGKIEPVDDLHRFFQDLRFGADKLDSQKIFGGVALDQVHGLAVAEHEGTGIHHFRECITAAVASCGKTHRQVGVPCERSENCGPRRINAVVHEVSCP